MKTLKFLGVVILIIVAALSVVYLNYSPESLGAGELTFGPEMTDVKISKFIVESLKKVAMTAF